MRKFNVPLTLVTVLLMFSERAFSADIRYVTFEAPPYQFEQSIPERGSAVTGLTVRTVECASEGVGWTTDVDIVPQKRAIQFLQQNQIDGYFAIAPSTSLDSFGHRTNPVSLERWHLVRRSDDPVLDNPRLGAISGSNEEAWLRQTGRTIYDTVRTPQQLVDLLQRKRIDQALMDQRLLGALENTDGLTSQFLRYVPLHVYFSESFAQRNLGILDDFNQQIPDCLNGNFALDSAENAQIRSIAYDLFLELEAALPVLKAIETGPKIKNLSEIMNLDMQWRAMAPDQLSAMAKLVAEMPASKAMAEWKKSRSDLVTEIMLTNNIGTLVAMSQLTSDFWQGDEPKFEQHIRSNSRDFYVSPIYYDESTARFQVTVSLPILSPGNWSPIGALIIGLDVEKALASVQHSQYLTNAQSR